MPDEKINAFLTTSMNSGVGDGSGDGDGYGYGSGSGAGFGYGSGDGDGDGAGDGVGDGSGYGSGDGSGYGSGDGAGDGSGYGSGDGDGIKRYNGRTVYIIDGVPTILTQVHGAVAHGCILNGDLTTSECFIVKGGRHFAHGATLQGAQTSLEEKMMDGLSVNKKIGQFLEKFKPLKEYPAKDFYQWHHILTGSCEMGRRQFALNHGIEVENATMTPEAFMVLTKDAFGGSVIRQLMEAWADKYQTGGWRRPS